MFVNYPIVQSAPAETTNYMVAGFSVIFIVIALYYLSIYLRAKKLRREYDTLARFVSE